MAQFFILRPVFAWVLALAIVLAGALALPQLPVERYPSVAPPSVTVTAAYPGASARTMNEAVLGLIERELSGVRNLLYFESSSDTSGAATLTATFRPGTNPELAQVDLQNRLKTVEPRLPQVVRQNGLLVESAAPNFLMIVGLTSPDGSHDELALGDYLSRHIVDELRRIPGVGKVQLFGSPRAMRIWVDPARLQALGLTMTDVSEAVGRQNLQIAPGRTGDNPALPGQRVSVPLTVQGQLETPQEFAAVVLRARADGGRVLLGDVARIELGAQSYGSLSREDGRPGSDAAVQLSPGANAVQTAAAVHARLGELGAALPPGIHISTPFDTAPFVAVSIRKVLQTLAEAMVLVFLVMWLFLRDLRCTLIPAIVAPVALLGTLAVMQATGFSVNVLTMFGLVLAIGIVVDDAIVVVEGVERLMAREGLSPRQATQRAMREITGAVVGITLVLTAVFIPMAFASGSVGVIYRQFTLSMAVSILFSAFLALTLTPALCATLLRPVAPGAPRGRRGVLARFDRGFEQLGRRYANGVARLLRRAGRMLLLFLGLCALLAFALVRLPQAFLPDEDQGYFITSFKLPSDATTERTLDLVRAYERHVASRPGIASNQSLLGFGFSGSGPSAALAFTNLKDWDQRHGATAPEEVAAAQAAMAGSTEGSVMSVMPPSIDGLGTTAGFALRLQDRAGQGDAALRKAQAQLLEWAGASALLRDVFADSLPPGPTVRLDIDRTKAEALGVAFAEVGQTLSAAVGSLYINDFPQAGRMQQVILQADAPARMQVEDVLRLQVRNRAGGMVALREIVTPVWSEAPQQLTRYQGYPAASLAGQPAPGVSNSQAMAEMERLARRLPPGFAIAWTGASLQERESVAQAPLLVALSMLVVFLVLAALYESWAIPLAVMLVVPLGLLGAVAAVLLRGLPNDVFFKVGMVTVIGLSAKNAILIVEFARQLHGQGAGLGAAALRAARLRLRPIAMTSLAFALGVLPLVLAGGASAETQQAIGTGVFGGMLSATVLAVFFVPVFFVAVVGLQERLRARGRQEPVLPAPAAPAMDSRP